MFPLSFYLAFLTPEQLANACALYGYLLELAIKDYRDSYAHDASRLVISKAGHVDLSLMIDGKLRRVEVKQNGGEFRHLCRGSSYIAYAIYIEPDLPLRQQFGYVLPMRDFKTAGASVNLFRYDKEDGDGYRKLALQTLYNYKAGDFHGRKAEKLADALETLGAIPFKEFFTE